MNKLFFNIKGKIAAFILFILGIFVCGCTLEDGSTCVGMKEESPVSVGELKEKLLRRSFESDVFITEWVVPAEETIVLPLDSMFSYNFVVDWGDDSDLGIVTAYNHPEARHTYMTSGTYRIRILGKCEAWNWPHSGMECRKYLTKVIQWGKVSCKSMFCAFLGCTALVSIPAPVPNVEDYSSAFDGCSSLTELPRGLFAGCYAAKDMGAAFRGCVGLKSLPDGLFSDCVNVTDFSGTFLNSGLMFLPDDLFENCSEVIDFVNTFCNCSNLISVPAGLFSNCTKVNRFVYTFKNCSSLKQIPLGLFDSCKKATIFLSTFHGCVSLGGTSPKTNGIALWERAGLIGYPASIIGGLCFKGCVGLSDYNAIPDGWK